MKYLLITILMISIILQSVTLASMKNSSGGTPEYELGNAYNAESQLRSNEERSVLRAFRAHRYRKADLIIPGHGLTDENEQDLPEEFFIDVPDQGELKHIWFRKHSVRSSHFRLRSYKNGIYKDVAPPPVRTYRGVLVDDPSVLVAATLDKDGLSAVVYGDAPGTWYIRPMKKAVPGSERSLHLIYSEEDEIPLEGICGMMDAEEIDEAGIEEGSADQEIFSELTQAVYSEQSFISEVEIPAFDANCTMKRAEVSYDMDNKEFLKHGDWAAAQSALESAHNSVATIYARDSMVVLEILETIIRESEFYDYELNDESTSLGEFETKWNDQSAGNTLLSYDMAQLITANNSGGVLGLAWVGSICTGNRYSWSVRNSGVMAHEMGHNWGLGHCDGDGDCHIMCSGYGGCNGSPTYFGDTKAAKIHSWSYSKSCIDDTPNPFDIQVPPRAFADAATIERDQLMLEGSLAIDVLANDYDGNCDLLSITGLSSPTNLGATLSAENGLLVYTPSQPVIPGVDEFTYTVDDGNGGVNTATVSVVVTVPELVGLWRLDETEGSIAVDGSRYRNHGLLNGDSTFGSSSGVYDGALELDGEDDYIDVGSDKRLALYRSDFTITAWIKIKQYQDSYVNAILSNRNGSTGSLFFVRGESDSSNKRKLCFDTNQTGGERMAYGTTQIGLDKWHHIAVKFKYNGLNENRAVLYVDGVPESITTNMSDIVDSSSASMLIGYDRGSSNYNFNGYIDDVRIYSYGLTTDEIYDVMRGGGAENPRPFDDSEAFAINTNLSWVPGSNSNGHHVYIGADPIEVANATESSPEYKGRRTEPHIFEHLDPNTVYYWRVDEIINDADIIQGNVWQFNSGNNYFEFSEDFEDGPGSWYVGSGSYNTSSTIFHSGSTSLAVNEDVDVLIKWLGKDWNYRVSVWFYDNADDTSVECVANIVDTNGGWSALGVNTERSLSNYAIRFGSDWYVSPVKRTTGWHEFIWDYRSGIYVKLYIDDKYVKTGYDTLAASVIYLGDWWGDSVSGNVFFDDITIETVRHLMTDFNKDGIVDMADLALLLSEWMNCGLPECH